MQSTEKQMCWFLVSHLNLIHIWRHQFQGDEEEGEMYESEDQDQQVQQDDDVVLVDSDDDDVSKNTSSFVLQIPMKDPGSHENYINSMNLSIMDLWVELLVIGH